jgi:hypothetical protein
MGGGAVGRAEADAADVAGQAVRVFRDELNGIGAVGLVDAHRPRRADAVAVQEQHNLADGLLLGPARDNPFGTLWADTGDLTQAAARFLLDDIEHGFAKAAHKRLRILGISPKFCSDPKIAHGQSPMGKFGNAFEP